MDTAYIMNDDADCLATGQCTETERVYRMQESCTGATARVTVATPYDDDGALDFTTGKVAVMIEPLDGGAPLWCGRINADAWFYRQLQVCLHEAVKTL